MKDCTITAKSSITRSLGPLILGNIYGPFMKVCDIHAISENISQLYRGVHREITWGSTLNKHTQVKNPFLAIRFIRL